MPHHGLSTFVIVCAFFAAGLRLSPATTIGSGQTVNDYSLAGQNIDFDSTLTYVDTGTDTNYDTGAGLVDLTQDFTNSLGTGPNQVQWTGSGGFTTGNPQATQYNVNIGALSPPATLTWGTAGFVPDGSILVLNGVNFENKINLGTDTDATRQIDLGTAKLGGSITGSGNLLLQAYAEAAAHDTFGPLLLDISGTLTLNNVGLSFGETNAASYNLTGHSVLETEVDGVPDMTLSGGSVWIASQLNGTDFLDQQVGDLSSTDPTTLIGLGGVTEGQNSSTALTVHSGYFAGQILDDTSLPEYGGSLIKEGPGIFTLANDNSMAVTAGGTSPGYSQGTAVMQGTLLCMNTTGSATGTGPITVMSGATLGGQGIVAPTGSSSITVQSGGLLDLRAFDPAHLPTITNDQFQVHLNPANRTTFQTGAELGFILAGRGKSSELAFTGLTADIPQVFFSANKVVFRTRPGAAPGTYTLITFDQPGAYTGTLAPKAGYSFIYQPQAILVQIPAAKTGGAVSRE